MNIPFSPPQQGLRLPACFRGPQGLIPDGVAAIGLLDDAIMPVLRMRRSRHVVTAGTHVPPARGRFRARIARTPRAAAMEPSA